VSVDQIPGSTRLRIYSREGTLADPHDHSEVLRDVVTSSDATDGLEVVSTPLPGFPRGLAILMNSAGRNFHLYRWEDLMPEPDGRRRLVEKPTSLVRHRAWRSCHAATRLTPGCLRCNAACGRLVVPGDRRDRLTRAG
jgi:hypothetical protein